MPIMLTFNTQFSVQWAFLSFQHFTFLKAFALVETSVLFISKIPPPQIVLRYTQCQEHDNKQ